MMNDYEERQQDFKSPVRGPEELDYVRASAKAFDRNFFKWNNDQALQSAQCIIPIVLDFIKPCSVIDVGCGTGVFLKVFKDHGTDDIVGIDGDYVDRSLLKIPADKFIARDLQKPFRLNRQFDLVISLEVADDLPPASADSFIESLSMLGPIILFSSAVPFQGGQNQLNEQWPEYWEQKFHARGFVLVDCIRKKIWNNYNIGYWYAQNILFFVKKDCLTLYPTLEREYVHTDMNQLSVVHPRLYLDQRRVLNDPINLPFKTLMSVFARRVLKKIRCCVAFPSKIRASKK